MLVVVESGSTKADWMLVQGAQEILLHTAGLNPNTLSRNDIHSELTKNIELSKVREQVHRLFFYGSGCSGSKVNAIMESALAEFFPNARITVNSDLMASVLACFNGNKQIACILGTGSNSCFYDGEITREEIPSLGFILGDEGSGSYFGKQLLRDFFYGRLPEPLHDLMSAMGLNKELLIERVYRAPRPNAFIASFMKVLIENKELPYSQRLIREGFQAFIEIHVKSFQEYKECEVNFVGSVAALLEEELVEVCEANEIRVGRILRRPLGRLVEIHGQQG